MLIMLIMLINAAFVDAIYANEFLKAAREEVRYNDLKDGKLKVSAFGNLSLTV